MEAQFRFVQVSPRFTLDRDEQKILDEENGEEYASGNTDLWIAIFRDRMNGWFFDPAFELAEEGQVVAAVHIVTPLIEALQEHHEGESSKSKSREFFVERARLLFPQLDGDDDKALDLLYSGVRCGFAHHGFLKDDEDLYNILITDDHHEDVEYDSGLLWIDASKYAKTIREGFEEYCKLVKRGGVAQQTFNEYWKKDWHMSMRAPSAGATQSTQQ